MNSPKRWPLALALVILAMLALQGLINAVRPILPWLIAGLGFSVVLGAIIWAILRRSTRW